LFFIKSLIVLISLICTLDLSVNTNHSKYKRRNCLFILGLLQKVDNAIVGEHVGKALVVVIERVVRLTLAVIREIRAGRRLEMLLQSIAPVEIFAAVAAHAFLTPLVVKKLCQRKVVSEEIIRNSVLRHW